MNNSNLKVLFITQEDPLYVAEFWEEFSKYIGELKDKGISFSGIVSLETLGKKSKVDLFKQVYGFYGPIGTLKLGLKYLKKRYRTIEYYANKMGFNFLKISKLNSKDFIEYVSKQDIVFSVAASQKFKKGLLEAPKYGCFNIHNGPLPKYRGMMPVFWQIWNGEKKIGITIHKMNEQLDDGEIILQEFVELPKGATVDEIMVLCKHFAAKLVVEFLSDFHKYIENPKFNDKNQATYFSFPKKENRKELYRNKGIKLI